MFTNQTTASPQLRAPYVRGRTDADRARGLAAGWHVASTAVLALMCVRDRTDPVSKCTHYRVPHSIVRVDGDRSTQRNPVKRKSSLYSGFIPFMLWSDLGIKTLEMMLGSAQVIAHRTGRIARAGHRPNASDQREFALMGQEKIHAAAESAQAMTAHLLTCSWSS